MPTMKHIFVLAWCSVCVATLLFSGSAAWRNRVGVASTFTSPQATESLPREKVSQGEDPAETEETENQERADEETLGEEQEEVVRQEPVTALEEEPEGLERASEEPGLKFRFQNIPLSTVIETVMRELGHSYVVDPRVKGTASIYTAGEIGRADVFEVLEQLLQLNGQGIIKQDDLYFIVPLGETTKIPHDFVVEPTGGPSSEEKTTETSNQPAEKQRTPAEVGRPEEPPEESRGEEESEETLVSTMSELDQESEERKEGVITYIVPLHYIPSAEMVQMITPFVSNGANIINYASLNILIITDFRENIDQALKIIRLLDTQYFDRNRVDLVPIRYHQAVDVARDLSQVFAAGDQTAGVRIVAIERLNSLLLVTRSPSVFERVKEWVQKLDSPGTGTSLKTFVYQVENNTAMNIAGVLAQLYQDGFSLSSEGAGGQQGGWQQPAAPTRDASFVPLQQFGGLGGSGQALGPSLAGRPMSNQTGIRAVVSENAKIIVNEFNNSLIVQATEVDYQFLLETIKQLDVLPRQVLIEAKIYSVELRDDLSFGVAAFLQERGAAMLSEGGQEPTSGGPATTGQISAEGTLSVMTRAFIGQGRQLEALVNALRSKTNVEIMEAPHLLALDGMQAQINVGAEVPVTTASFGDPLRAGSATAFVNSIQFRPTGVTLLIMPRISASGIVMMDLAIEVSSASGAALTPTINRNFVTTSLIVRDGQTVAIAGIISDQTELVRKRIPVLGDIPILGALFGQTTRNRRRAELIFFITPHVIQNLPTATELTLDFQRALRKAYDFIRDTEAKESELIQERRKRELEIQ